MQMFASGGGAVAALALLAAHPEDVSQVVAHEPPIMGVLPDAELAERANDAVGRAYQERGWGAGLAAFLAMSMWQGEFTEEFFAQPLPNPARFGLPVQDDGTREDPLLSGTSAPVTSYQPDLEARTPRGTVWSSPRGSRRGGDHRPHHARPRRGARHRAARLPR
ncbi:hypothetical protein [Brachybacterium sp. GPGPB12]|uniref:hypothetical protein n=1 Tax=Brachybacterium sp. GPGPB12 TaxID=3023517 RepID=UPI0031343ACD